MDSSHDVIRSLRPGGAYTTRKIGLGFVPESGRVIKTEAELEAAFLLVETEPKWWALDSPPSYTEAVPIPPEPEDDSAFTMDLSDPPANVKVVEPEGDAT